MLTLINYPWVWGLLIAAGTAVFTTVHVRRGGGLYLVKLLEMPRRPPSRIGWTLRMVKEDCHTCDGWGALRYSEQGLVTFTSWADFAAASGSAVDCPDCTGTGFHWRDVE
jgi:hypothetical protein